jgi:Spy/CpxP family protein refolding chaperone
MRVTLALTTAMVLLTAATTFGQPAPGGGPPPPPPGVAPLGPPPGGPGGPGGDQVALLTSLLELTDAQQSAWKQARTDSEATVTALAEQVRALQGEIRSALDASDPDAATIGARLIAVRGLEVKIKAAMNASKDALKALLTAEQLAKLAVFDTIQELMHKAPPSGGPGPR